MIKEMNLFSENIINPHETILNAMKRIDEQSVKVLFVVDASNKLIAALTDGDIRRAILGGFSLDAQLYEVANHNPIFADKNASIKSVEEIMYKKGINAVPVVNEDGEVLKIYYKGYIESDNSCQQINVPVVLMAGGKGTRLYPYTKILPKPLIPINEVPISERIIRSFERFGCRSYYMILNYKKNMIKAYYSDTNIQSKLMFVEEESPLGTGGGLKLLEEALTDTFILTNCDILILEDVRRIIKHHEIEKNDVTMVCSLKNYEIPYGVVNFSKGGEIESFEEKPHMSFFTNTGYYVIEPCIMDYINNDEVIDMPDIVERMRKDGKRVGVYPISENSWLDMGQFDSMESMERRFEKINDSNLD